MLRIRLARTGRKKLAHYRVVVSDSSRPPTGGSAEELGHYNPHTKELSIDSEKVQNYINQGVQPSGRMVRILQERKDVTLPEWAKENLVEKEEVASEPEASESAVTEEDQEKETEQPPDSSEDTEAESKQESAEAEAGTDSKEETEETTESESGEAETDEKTSSAKE